MQQKSLIKILCFLFVLLFMQPQYGQCADKTPEQFLEDFYSWYITTSKGVDGALQDKEINNYVAQEVIERVKKSDEGVEPERRDYFIKREDTPLSMDGVRIGVGKVTAMGANIFVAPVTITSRIFDIRPRSNIVIVIFKKKNGMFKIVKCVDSYSEA